MKSWMVVAAAVLSASLALAEESPSSQPTPMPRGPRTPLRLQVLVTRHQGEKKISSRPYTLQLYSGDQQGATVFVGNQVPLRFSDKGVQTILFKDVGTKLRCLAGPSEGGRYEVSLKYEDSFLAPAQGSGGRAGEDDLPVWRMLSGEIRAYVRDGETTTLSSTVDPVTGDVVKAEMTFTAIK
jgi:hypothetical protein